MSTFYASASGGTGTGAIGDPWSLAYAGAGAGGALRPGDTVLARGGTYSATDGFTLSVSGAARNPITFRNYPAETPILNGAYAAFDSVGNSAWEVFDAGRNVYRSVASSGFTAGEVGGHVQLASGAWRPLATHDPLDCLLADTQEYHDPEDYFLGPGLAEELSGGRIYIRLTNAESYIHPGRTIAQVVNLDPRQHALKIYSGQTHGFTVSGGHLVIDGFVINDYYTMIALTGPDCTFRNISGRFGFIGVRLETATDFIFEDCTIDGLMDPDDWWFSWIDAKGGRTIGDSCRKAGFGGDNPVRGAIRGCTISNVYDGMSVAAAHDIEIADNDFINCWDDGWQMYSSLYHINIHDNRFLGAGPSHDNSGSNNPNTDPGTVFIHHNIIDTSQQVIEWGRYGTFVDGGNVEGLGEMIALSLHGQADEDRWDHPWKLYYNTYITGDETINNSINAQRFNNTAAGHHDPAPHEVLNNIFVHTRTLGRDMETDTGLEIFDGNVYDPTADVPGYARFSFIHTSTGDLTTNAQIGSTAKIRATQALADTLVYSDGYEASGLDADPQLDGDYEPQNALVQVGAVDLTDRRWPGVEGYQATRGAVGAQETVARSARRTLRRRAL